MKKRTEVVEAKRLPEKYNRRMCDSEARLQSTGIIVGIVTTHKPVMIWRLLLILSLIFVSCSSQPKPRQRNYHIEMVKKSHRARVGDEVRGFLKRFVEGVKKC